MGSVRTFTQDDRPANPELFISYASDDLDRASVLHTRLVVEGFTVWFDKRGSLPAATGTRRSRPAARSPGSCCR
jgi:hypothetical protein